ncbi:MarR family winged helix-turn-helix transcriptional regulator [Pseudorhodoplanes sp.]|uniref:MarR family winged helix-turn-helix transcriptional regulator n=1 Tax=Pseudorhodoplanes sp. TaxID=1934341 RepID=UPI003D0CD5E9
MKRTKTKAEAPNFSHWEINEYVPALVTWLYNKTAANASRLYRKRFGVGLAEWRIIAYLGIHDKGTNAEICDYIGLDKAAVSRSISSLRSRGYLVTRPRNGRDIEVRLTPQGLKLGNRILAVALEIEENLMHGINATERRAYIKTTNAILRNLIRVQRFVDDAYLRSRKLT